MLSDQRGGEASSLPSPRKPSPRCLSVVRATGHRGTLRSKIPMDRRRPEEADVETTKTGGAADVLSAETFKIHDFTVVKNVQTRSD